MNNESRHGNYRYNNNRYDNRDYDNRDYDNRDYDNRYRKLFISVPVELFEDIKKNGLLPRIDEICTDLLREYIENLNFPDYEEHI